MNISVIAPPYIPIPPEMYGGIELVVFDIVEELGKQGEDIFLFAHKDSKVSCRFYPYFDNKNDFGLNSSSREKRYVGTLAAKFAYAMSGYLGAEVIHDHTLSMPIVDIPTVHTLHGPANEPTVKRCVELSENPHNNFVFISKRQEELYMEIDNRINSVGVVHNSVDVNKLDWTENKEDFFLFVGRANWEKGLDLAVRVASKAEVGLVMAVKMSEDFEREFYKEKIQPWLDDFPKGLHLELHEEISKDFKFDLYKRSKCTLFTSQWEEPFGLVMIESMACGTPVIALDRGAAPEVIIDGKTGFIVKNEEEMVDAVKEIEKIKPLDCRRHVEENFSREKMASRYLEIYKKVSS